MTLAIRFAVSVNAVGLTFGSAGLLLSRLVLTVWLGEFVMQVLIGYSGLFGDERVAFPKAFLDNVTGFREHTYFFFRRFGYHELVAYVCGGVVLGVWLRVGQRLVVHP